MKSHRLDLILGIVAGALVLFTAGYLVGRSTTKDLVAISLGGKPSVSAEAEASRTPQPEATLLRVNLNTAGEEELRALPGIGEVLAKRIVRYREETGGFRSVDELREVYGISDSEFSAIEAYLTIE